MLQLLQILVGMDVHGHRIDLGKLELLCRGPLKLENGDERTAALTALLIELHAEVNFDRVINPMEHPRDIVLYGFGRIGRILARLLIEKAGSGTKLMIRAIVVRPPGVPDLQKRVDLFLRDSVHGEFPGTIALDKENNAFIANGVYVRLLYAEKPDKLDYTQYGINNAIVIDNTGSWRDRKGLAQHLASPGVAQVILTAPGKGDVPNIVAGVNDKDIKPVSLPAPRTEGSRPVSPSHSTPSFDASEPGRIMSAASCTTNAVIPVLKAMNDKFGIVSGHLETVHSYTNDQNLIDNFHKSARRGRAATLNMVLTETGADEAVAKCLPELKGKLTANAIRVPTPNGSLAILILTLSRETTVEEVNNHLFHEAHFGDMSSQIDITESEEITSLDIVGSRSAAVVDRYATIVKGNRCNLYVWYDNEHGYSCQVIRVVQKMAGIDHVKFPAEAAIARKVSFDGTSK